MADEGDPIMNMSMTVPDPGSVLILFRFFNDCGDVTEVEAFASMDGTLSEPVAIVPAVEPYTVREAHGQFAPVNDPRHFSVMIRRNGLPVGVFHVGPSVSDIVEAEATFHVDPMNQDVSVILWAKDENGNVIFPL